MLIFRLRRILALRFINVPSTYLTRIEFKRDTAVSLANDRVLSLKIKHLERLCRALNCTPNDLFEWKPGAADAPLPEAHALNSLRRETKPSASITQMVKDMPIEKLDKIEALINELKSQE